LIWVRANDAKVQKMDRTLRLTGRIDFLSKTWIIVAPVGFNIHADVLVARCVSSKTRKSEGDDEGDFCAVADVADARCIWVAEPSIAKTERDAMMDVAPDKPAMWMFVNPNVRGPLGYPTGYEIMSGITAASLLDF